ncbi:hypothetical protein [Dyella sp. C9]|uniref:hypothetical protein n=1 Tax=Dyella sp. C9 TaxID=2202154 RepID=UPI000DEF9A05|nr:hypothetical protein [Dyella sp. C9]
MLVDIYQSSTHARRFAAVQTGNPVAFSKVSNESDFIDAQLVLQGIDLASGTYFVGLDAAPIVQQVADKGFALFTASMR